MGQLAPLSESACPPVSDLLVCLCTHATNVLHEIYRMRVDMTRCPPCISATRRRRYCAHSIMASLQLVELGARRGPKGDLGLLFHMGYTGFGLKATAPYGFQHEGVHEELTRGTGDGRVTGYWQWGHFGQ